MTDGGEREEQGLSVVVQIVVGRAAVVWLELGLHHVISRGHHRDGPGECRGARPSLLQQRNCKYPPISVIKSIGES